MSVTSTTRRWPRALALPTIGIRTLANVCLVFSACMLPLLAYLPLLHEPFMRDEGFYAAVAQAMRHGSIPYQDAFDNKPPMIFAWYYAAFALFGEHVWAPRLVAAALLSGATGLVYAHGRLIYGHTMGLIGAVAFGTAFAVVRLQTNANTEYFMVPFIVAMGFCFALGQRSESAWWYLASGLAGGVSIMTKQIAVFPVLFLIGYAAWPHARENGVRFVVRRETLLSAGAIAAGAGIAGLAIAAPFIVAGAFGDMFDALVSYSLSYSGESSLLRRVLGIGWTIIFLSIVAGPWVVLAVTGILSLVRRRTAEAPFLVGWLVAASVGTVAVGRFYDHYNVALIPAAALVIPPGALYLKDHWKSAAVKVIVLGYLPLSMIAPLYLNGSVYLQPTVEQRHTAKYRNDQHTRDEVHSAEFGSWIASVTEPGDYIYNLGFHSELYFHADRRAPTRFLFDHPFMAGERYTREAIADLEANPPRLVIDSATYEYRLTGDGYPREGDATEPAPDAKEYWGEPLRTWVRENYEFIGQHYYADVYVWRGGGS